MKQAVRFVLALAVALVAPRAGFGQQVPVIIEAESGTVGSEFTPGVDGAVNYIGIATTVGGDNPDHRQSHRQLQRHVSGGRHLGAVRPAPRRPDAPTRRPQRRQPLLRERLRAAGARPGRRVDHRQQPLEHRLRPLPSDRVVGGGVAQTNVWKWIKLSGHGGSRAGRRRLRRARRRA